MKIITVVLWMVLITGCSVSSQPSPQVTKLTSQTSPSPFEFVVVSEFVRGTARIAPGMAKEQVLAELPKSGREPFWLRFR